VLEEAWCTGEVTRGSKNISLIRDLKSDIPYLGDEAFLRQLFLIFSTTPFKYSGSGTSIKVRLEKMTRVIKVHFEDQAHRYLYKRFGAFIFERFYRAGSSNNAVHIKWWTGTGDCLELLWRL